MKIAIVHDWLGEVRGGAEEVLIRLTQLYPQADIFCLTYSPKKYPELTDRSVTTSWLGKLPAILRKKTGLLTVFAPHAIEHLDLTGYDVVISSSNSFAKGVRAPREAKHICYCYSPMRYVWDYWPQWLEERTHNPVSRAYVSWLTHRLRLWDWYSSRGVDKWVAISETVAQRIKTYYQAPSAVVYPGVIDTAALWKPNSKRHGYYITLSTLTSYKRIDLAIKACIASKRKLMIVGEGPEWNNLHKLAEGHDNIVFMGRVSEAEKIQYLQEANGLIFASEEDFGIAPLEAVAAGTPVIAYNKGGLTETIVDGKSGLFFNQQTVKSLADALSRFETAKWDHQVCHEQARKFDLKRFDAAIVKELTGGK
jgi:glycosyltransferase involved in cell wall biosynthesis